MSSEVPTGWKVAAAPAPSGPEGPLAAVTVAGHTWTLYIGEAGTRCDIVWGPCDCTGGAVTFYVGGTGAALPPLGKEAGGSWPFARGKPLAAGA